MLEPVTDLPLFVYGTLTDGTFVGHLLEHPVEGEPAVLVDFERLELVGFDYPVVVEAPGERVEGLIYRGLSAEEFRRLDAYEGVAEGLYRRVVARVVTGDGDGEATFVYVPAGRTLRRYGSPRLG